MGPCSRPMSPGQLELWIIFFFPPEALSCPRHRGHRTSEAERTRWARLPSRCGSASWSFGSFFFSSRSLVCRCHPGRCTSEAERTRWARLPSRCGSASWSFGSFFFPPEALSVAVTRGACTSDAERTRWARLPGRCGPVSWSFGSFFFFFFLQKPSLVPVTGGTLHLRPRGHDGPGFQADVARSAGALDLFFFFLPEALLSPSPVALYI